MTCTLCGDNAEVHLAAMDEFHEIFRARYNRAVDEYNRLKELMRNVAWYNFETVCRTWREPWPPSMLDSPITMHGARYSLLTKRGRCREHGTFPVYFRGTVRDAPPLPPQIVLHELTLALELIQELEAQTAAPYEWAPGGRLYERLVRESEGANEYERRRISNERVREENERETRKGGIVARRCNGLERASETATEASPADVLGRVCSNG